jgi:hypothetical protein
MENDWVPALYTGKIHQAILAREVLQDADIESILVNKKDSVLLIGDIELRVKSDVLVQAKYLLKDFKD